ncbi:MAG TPA: DUF488 domain-containing protein, partial [Thermoanaerobaculia bacterium]|nr:DUF488 domain-containing protein [Thermoanaerobaculia bacterium]
FVHALQASGVTRVVDVRTVPRSRKNPQYDRDALPGSLAAVQIHYEHLAALGGLRGRSPDVPPDVNAFWRNQSFHNYADYAMGETFRAGLAPLIDLGRERRSAVMCAEAVWWRCHRRIIADYLLASGESVLHIMGSTVEPARQTEAARRTNSGVLAYPAAA